MLTACLLSWKRTKNLRRILDAFKTYPVIDEIIVWNNNKDVVLNFNGVKCINSNQDMGLFTRFASAALAKNQAILFHDDDLLAPADTVEQLYHHWINDPTICHTLHGRNTDEGGYNFKNVYGDVTTCLTRCTVAPRKACTLALSEIHRFTDLNTVPYGNGEDIIVSHAARRLSGRLNRAYEFPVDEFEQEGDVSMHQRVKHWVQQRSAVVERCHEVFLGGKTMVG